MAKSRSTKPSKLQPKASKPRLEREDEAGFAKRMFVAVLDDVASVDPVAALLLEREISDDWPPLPGDNFLRMAMIRLPKIGKAFDKALSSQHFDWQVWKSLSWVGKETGHFVPVLDSLFWEKGSFSATAAHQAWELDVDKVMLARQLLYMYKKWERQCPEPYVQKAILEFWSIEDQMRVPRSIDNDLIFHVCGGQFADGLVGLEAPPILRRLVTTLDRLSWRLAPVSDLDPMDLLPKHGPGAVSDLSPGGDKYTFPTWPRVIEEMYRYSYYGSLNKRVADRRPIGKYKFEAQLHAVPKTYDKPRLIAAEPVAHQFLQQGLKRWIRANYSPILKVMVDIQDQTHSRNAALQASKDGRHATIDLSSASDRMSLWSVECLYSRSPKLLDSLIRARTNRIRDKYGFGDGKEVRKYAHQGNATTFPVQSNLYAVCALSALIVAKDLDMRPLSTKRLRELAEQVRVYGDDIIVPRECVTHLVQILEFLQLKVNPDKSHIDGYFRESCGMDAYRGSDVTPCYVSRAAPYTPGVALEAFVEQSNNAHRRGLWALANWMRQEVEGRVSPDLLPVSNLELGCTTFFTFVNGTAAARWRTDYVLHQAEVRGFCPKPRGDKEKRDSWQSALQFMLEGPDPLTTWESGWLSEKLEPKYKASWVAAYGAPLDNVPRPDLCPALKTREGTVMSVKTRGNVDQRTLCWHA